MEYLLRGTLLCRTAAGVVAAYRSVGADRVVIKAQVLTGGRGKAGGVKLVNNTEDAYQEAKNILGMSIKGLPVNQILVSEAVDITAEYYVSFTIDRKYTFRYSNDECIRWNGY